MKPIEIETIVKIRRENDNWRVKVLCGEFAEVKDYRALGLLARDLPDIIARSIIQGTTREIEVLRDNVRVAACKVAGIEANPHLLKRDPSLPARDDNKPEND